MIRFASICLFILAGLIVAILYPGSASAHEENGGGATWAKASGNREYGYWHATIEDTKDDGECVSLWTINADMTNRTMIAFACYGEGPVAGSAFGGAIGDEVGIRMWLGTDEFLRWSTLIQPQP